MSELAKRSSTAISTEREALLDEYYIEQDWITTRVTKKSTWSKGKDFFGIGDILAYKQGMTKITDVSSHAQKGKIEIMKQWILDNIHDIPEKFECEVAVWKKKGKREKIKERFLITTINRDLQTSKREVAVKPEWYDIIKEKEKNGGE